MKEERIYYANDRSTFTTEESCLLYERIIVNLERLNEQAFPPELAIHIRQLQKSLFSIQAGEQRLQYMLSIIHFARLISRGVADLSAIMDALFIDQVSPIDHEQEEVASDDDWKSAFGGIARELVDLPHDATREEVCGILRRHDSNRLMAVLETLEESPIPLRTYKLIRDYLY